MVQLAGLVALVLRRRASIPQESDKRKEAAMKRLFDLVFDAVLDPHGEVPQPALVGAFAAGDTAQR
jgi:hypothetical protein